MAIYGTYSKATRDDGSAYTFSEVSASASVRSPGADDGGYEYAFDARGAEYPSTPERSTRANIYDAWVGGRTSGGVLGLRVGQMWLNDLGGLGALAGLLAETRPFPATAVGRFRFGLFAGLEPKNFELGWVEDVRKGGAYVALDGERGRKHILGWVVVRNTGLTERSVMSMTNFVPIGSEVFIYQALEYDLQGPAGQSEGKGLTYFFVNGRVRIAKRFEVQGLYHKGNSIDSRSITQDILNGRPVDSRLLQGFLFESAGGRLTVELTRNLRVYGGYAREKNSSSEDSYGRLNLGLSATNVLGSGLDVNVSDNRYDTPTGKYDGWYASVGRSLGSSIYLTADFSNSLSILRVTGSDGIVVENRPRARRFGLSGTVNLGRSFSILLNGELLDDDTSRETRVLSGVAYRF